MCECGAWSDYATVGGEWATLGGFGASLGLGRWHKGSINKWGQQCMIVWSLVGEVAGPVAGGAEPMTGVVGCIMLDEE